MLRIGLREHHQFDVAGVSLQTAIGVDQIFDFIGRQCQSEILVCLLQAFDSARQNIDGRQGSGRVAGEKRLACVQLGKNRLGHAVVQIRHRNLCVALQRVTNPAFDTADLSQAAMMRDIGRLACPGRDGSRSGDHVESLPVEIAGLHLRSVGQQGFEDGLLIVVQRFRQIDQMHETAAELPRLEPRVGQFLFEFR